MAHMRAVRRAGFWLVAAGFSYAVWLVHDDSAKLSELLAGLVVAAIAATGTELVRGQRVARMAFRPRFVRRTPLLLLSSVRDCVTLTFAAFAQLLDRRDARGITVEIPFRHGEDEDPYATGRRALAMGLGSFAPGTVVIGIDPERAVLVAHQLPASGDPSDLDPLGIR